MEILRAEHLTKTYGKDENVVAALNDVSLSIEKGEFVAIIGASGSGKSTLLHMLGGVDRPTSGTVMVDGKDIFKQNDEQLSIFRRREIGLVYQFFNLIPVLTVVENITMPVLLDHRKVNQDSMSFWSFWGFPKKETLSRISFPAVSSSVSRSAVR